MIWDLATDRDLSVSMIDACAEFNRGYTAGKKSGMFNLGASGMPIMLVAENILDYFCDMQSVMDEAIDEKFPFVERNLGCIIHPMLAALLRDSWVIWEDMIRFKVRGLDFTFLLSAHTPKDSCGHFIFFGAENAIMEKKLVKPEWLGQLYCRR